MKRLPWSLIALLAATSSALAQSNRPTSQGDSTVVPAIQRRAQATYDSTGGRWGGFVFTTENLTGLAGAYGTDIKASYLRTAPARLVLEQWTRRASTGLSTTSPTGRPT
jgi:hypothetical protein